MKYAAKYGVYSLYEYEELSKKPNLVTPLKPSQIEGVMEIDLAEIESLAILTFEICCEIWCI